MLCVVLGLSILPDLDSVAGFLFGDLGAYHNQFSHSLFSGLAAALLAAGIARLAGSTRSAAWFWIALASYELHVLMDFFTLGRGVRLFWPLTDQRFRSPVPLFYGLRWSEGWISPYHLITIATETLSVGILWLLCARIRRRRRHAG
jgi:inner membrane protein